MPRRVSGAVFFPLVASLHVTNVALMFGKLSISEWLDRRLLISLQKFFLDGLVLPIIFAGFLFCRRVSLFIGNATVCNYFGLLVCW